MDTKNFKTVRDTTNAIVQKVIRAKKYQDLKMRLMDGEIHLGGMEREAFQTPAPDRSYIAALDRAWSVICDAAVGRALRLAKEDKSFADELNASPEEMKEALYDNYLHGAFAAAIRARKEKTITQLPMLAYAAFNKHSYRGYGDEIACLRLLLWAGFDPNAQASDGMTALHYMASLKVRPISHHRAVRLLLNAGASPNPKNWNGDTPLCFLSGNTNWYEAHTQAAWQLLNHGADPLIEANDGVCAYSLLKKMQGTDEGLDAFIATIEATAGSGGANCCMSA